MLQRAFGRLLVVTALMGTGCSDPRQAPADATVDASADAAADCPTLGQQWRSLIATVSRDCQVDGDCALAGTLGPDHPLGGASWSGIGFYGESVNAAAYAQTSGPQLESSWSHLDCGLLSDPICIGRAACQEGQCVIVDMYCCTCDGGA